MTAPGNLIALAQNSSSVGLIGPMYLA